MGSWKYCVDKWNNGKEWWWLYHNILWQREQDHIFLRWMSVSHPARQRPPRPSVAAVGVNKCGFCLRIVIAVQWNENIQPFCICQITLKIYLYFLDAVSDWDRSNTHQWVWLYTESPLLTFLLLCMANTAPTHNTVLQRTSCTEVVQLGFKRKKNSSQLV